MSAKKQMTAMSLHQGHSWADVLSTGVSRSHPSLLQWTKPTSPERCLMAHFTVLALKTSVSQVTFTTSARGQVKTASGFQIKGHGLCTHLIIIIDEEVAAPPDCMVDLAILTKLLVGGAMKPKLVQHGLFQGLHFLQGGILPLFAANPGEQVHICFFKQPLQGPCIVLGKTIFVGKGSNSFHKDLGLFQAHFLLTCALFQGLFLFQEGFLFQGFFPCWWCPGTKSTSLVPILPLLAELDLCFSKLVRSTFSRAAGVPRAGGSAAGLLLLLLFFLLPFLKDSIEHELAELEAGSP